MTKRIAILSSVVLIAATSYANAQTADSQSTIHVGFNKTNLVSNFASPEEQNKRLESGVEATLRATKPAWYFNGSARLTYPSRSSLNIDGTLGGNIGGIKKVRTFLGTRYLFSSQHETILNNAPVLMTGLIRKQVLLFDISEVFSFAKTRFQISYLVGGVELTNKITVQIDGRQINAGEESIHENILFFPERKLARGFGISVATQPIKKLSLSVSGEKLYLSDNPTKRMSTRQYRVQMSVAYQFTRRFGLKLEDSITDIAQPSALGSRSISTQMVIKF